MLSGIQTTITLQTNVKPINIIIILVYAPTPDIQDRESLNNLKHSPEKKE